MTCFKLVPGGLANEYHDPIVAALAVRCNEELFVVFTSLSPNAG